MLGIEDPVWSCFTVKEEVVCGATDTVAVWLRGAEERLDGAVAIFAISRPSSPTRPWSSDISSRISCSSFRTSGPLLGCSCGGGGVVFFSFSLSTSHFSTSFMRSSKARTCPTVHFSSFSKRLAMASNVPGTSRVPWVLNCAYIGGAS